MLAYLASEDPDRLPRARRTEFPVDQRTGQPGSWPTCQPAARTRAATEPRSSVVGYGPPRRCRGGPIFSVISATLAKSSEQRRVRGQTCQVSKPGRSTQPEPRPLLSGPAENYLGHHQITTCLSPPRTIGSPALHGTPRRTPACSTARRSRGMRSGACGSVLSSTFRYSGVNLLRHAVAQLRKKRWSRRHAVDLRVGLAGGGLLHRVVGRGQPAEVGDVLAQRQLAVDRAGRRRAS